jgi:hypothetical protein
MIDRMDRIACSILRTEAPVTRLVGEALHYWHRWKDLGLMTTSARRSIVMNRLQAIARALGAMRVNGDADTALRLNAGQVHFGKLNDAARHFLPRLHPGALTILASQMAHHHRYLPGRWHRVSAQLEIRHVPGTHLSCITREGKTIAAELCRKLERRGTMAPCETGCGHPALAG